MACSNQEHISKGGTVDDSIRSMNFAADNIAIIIFYQMYPELIQKSDLWHEETIL